MKRKLRIFSNIAIICLSVCMFAFGVYAASTVSVTTSGTVTFTADNVDATIVRTVSGYDPAKSTVVIDDVDEGTATVNINKTETPEGALHKIDDKFVNEKLVFDENATPIVMTFTITNNSTDRNLKYVLGGSATGTGIKTKLMTGDRLILIDDDNYLDPKVEDDDAFVNEATITITFTVADANSSCELEYNYNIDLSVVKPIVADDFTITSTNSTYGSVNVLSKVGNTVKVNVLLNEGGQFMDFTQSGVEIEQEFDDIDFSNRHIKYMLRLISSSEIDSITANFSQFNDEVFTFSMSFNLECKDKSSFNLTHVDVPQVVYSATNGWSPICGVDFTDCTTLTSIKLNKTNTWLPCLSGTRVTEITLPNIDSSLNSYFYNQPYSFSSGALDSVGIQIKKLIIEDDGTLFSEDFSDEDGFLGDRLTSLEIIQVSPYNPYYDSRNNCNAIINSETNKLVLGCIGTIIPNSVESLGGESFGSLPPTFNKSLSIPTSVKKIHYEAFCKTYNSNDNSIQSGLTTINYAGTKSEWNSIKIVGGEDAEPFHTRGLSSLTVVCTDGAIIIK